ncbi:RloB family protein [Chitinophaga nivalis]|uniref:RloB family protein n=1 Tax=Chitinophaga nivalis TaxID=2991709 RepID=A0ABT3IT29_9BACT|nr:RloB family protein [Chitinophaga nivalis]MCW3463167.1 RloB family protein [Chitinophaga nivalis]MCW3487143.1 RloB family protein [Chitinophaga nivalis]
MARSTEKRKGSGRQTFAILVDGETEKWYLEQLRNTENPAGITIKPDLPRKTKLEDQYLTVKDNADIYDLSIWIIDLDVVIRENKVSQLITYLAAVKGNKKIQILINTPCLEYWFLQHVNDCGKYFADCHAVMRELKKHAPLQEYSKSARYFIQTQPDIYQRLKPYLNNGISNARKRGAFDPVHPQKGKAEIYKLFEIPGLLPTLSR